MTSCDNYCISDRVLYCNFSLSDDDFVIKSKYDITTHSRLVSIYILVFKMLIFGLCFILYIFMSLGFSPLLASAVLIFTLHNNYYTTHSHFRENIV